MNGEILDNMDEVRGIMAEDRGINGKEMREQERHLRMWIC
jgi:hypothetical protein